MGWSAWSIVGHGGDGDHGRCPRGNASRDVVGGPRPGVVLDKPRDFAHSRRCEVAGNKGGTMLFDSLCCVAPRRKIESRPSTI